MVERVAAFRLFFGADLEFEDLSGREPGQGECNLGPVPIDGEGFSILFPHSINPAVDETGSTIFPDWQGFDELLKVNWV